MAKSKKTSDAFDMADDIRKISMPRYSDLPLLMRAERLLFLRLQFLPKNISVYSMDGTTKQKGTICFVLKLAVRNEAMRKIS